MTEPVSEAAKAFNKRKLMLAQRIRQDRELTASTKIVGAELASLTNFRTGYSWAAEVYLAEQLNLAHRTIKNAVRDLKAAGYFTVEKVGRSNRYLPNFAAIEKGQNLPLSEIQQGQNLPLLDGRQVQDLPLSAPDRGKNGGQQGQKTSANRGKKGTPISLENSLGISARAETGAVGAAPDGAAGPGSQSSADMLGGFAREIEAAIGADAFKGWLSKAAFVSEEGDELTLAAPTRFVADKIESFYGGSVLNVWRASRPWVSKLRVIVAKGLEAAPAPNVRSIAEQRAIAGRDDAAWLDDVGVDIVSRQLHEPRNNAREAIRSWLKRAGFDATGLRQVIVAAAEQDLEEGQFRAVVKQRAEKLATAHQPQLKFGPEQALRRSAS